MITTQNEESDELKVDLDESKEDIVTRTHAGHCTEKKYRARQCQRARMSSSSAAAKANDKVIQMVFGVFLILGALAILAGALARRGPFGAATMTPFNRVAFSLIALMVLYGGLKLTGVL
jgi:hypothetical protein